MKESTSSDEGVSGHILPLPATKGSLVETLGWGAYFEEVGYFSQPMKATSGIGVLG